MDRRSFLKQVSLYSAGILLTPPVFQIHPGVLGASKAFAQTSTPASKLASNLASPDIKVAKGINYPTMVQQTLESLGGLNTFVKSGDKVVIKPNIGWDRNIDQAANTHPQVVSELIKQSLDAGAKKVLLFDRTCNEERRCYSNSGIQSAVKEIGDRRVRLDYIDDRKFIPVTIKNGSALKEWSFYKDALKADIYINVPVAKHHSLSTLSLGLKNIMGVIGGWRGRIHYKLADKLADLNMVIRPDLTVVDATRVIVRNGPQGGNLDDVKVLNTIVASKDPVAADAFATTLFSLKPNQIDSTVAAFNKGLGQMELDQCQIQYLSA